MERFHARCQHPDCTLLRVGTNAEGVFNWGHAHERQTGHSVEFRRTSGIHDDPLVFDL